MDYYQFINQIFFYAGATFETTKRGGEILHSGNGFGDLHHDTEIKIDLAIGKDIQKSIRINSSFRNSHITVEGLSDIAGFGDKSLWICVDPVDGSLNYVMRNQALGLPVACCVTILRKKRDARFADIEAAGVMDFRSNDSWIAIREKGFFLTRSCGEPIATNKNLELDISRGIVIAEMYYPENRELVNKIFAGEKGWIRNPGSAAYEMAMVANGTALAFICDRQKLHELGAGYALVKGAGGVVWDFNGQDLAHHSFKFNTQLPVIMAANKKIADELLARVQKTILK